MAVEDQVPEKEQSIEEKPQVIEEKKEGKKEEYESAQEFYDAGFEKFGEEMGGGEEEIAPKKKAAKDEECVGCGKDIAELPTEIDQVLWDRVDYKSDDWPKPYKVKGKVVWAKDEEDRTRRVQMAENLTLEHQTLAEEKKAFEAEKTKTVGEVEALAQRTAESIKRLDELSSLIYKDPKVQEAVSAAEKEAGTRELTEAEILQSYGIDPDDLTVEDYSKKIALDNYALKQQLKKSGEESLSEKRKTDFIILEKFAGNIVKVGAEARKNYPYEEIMGVDEAGNPVNKTAVYFTTEVVKRIKEQEGKPANERKDAGAITIEIVKELHEMQKGKTPSKEGMVDLSTLTLEQLKTARPELFGEKPGGNDKDQSSTEKSERKSAPSLRTEKHQVDINHWAKSRGETPRFMSVEEAMKAGFEEIDFDEE